MQKCETKNLLPFDPEIERLTKEIERKEGKL